MALTKLQALDKFCLYNDFVNTALPAETKVQFLQRKQKEWAIGCVVQQTLNEQEDAKQQAVAIQVQGVDL